jgi:hypothetical protein
VATSVRTSQETHYVSATEPNRLMLFGETVAVYCENHTEHINTLCGQNAKSWRVKAGGKNIVTVRLETANIRLEVLAAMNVETSIFCGRCLVVR